MKIKRELTNYLLVLKTITYYNSDERSRDHLVKSKSVPLIVKCLSRLVHFTSDALVTL